jgi:deoxyribodipyrimidine photolyase-related protein
MSTQKLILILGDQLSPHISSLRNADPATTVILMAEADAEAQYVRHHKKKIALVFSAMRHFAQELRGCGWQVQYIKLDDPENQGTLTGQIAHAIEHYNPKQLCVTAPAEWRLADDVAQWSEKFGLPVTICEDDRFIATASEFADWAQGRKALRMEYFYRDMRRKTGLLMDGDKPVGGKWNFDSENRKPAGDDMFMPQPASYAPDTITQEVLALVSSRFAGHFGDLEPFAFAVTRKDAEAAFEYFVVHALPRFGDFQDAMLRGQPFLYHAVISPYMNIGLLDPLAVCRRVEKAYEDGKVPINAAEGFIRQIIGWREYVRGIYWMNMPGYGDQNFFEHTRALPEYYWSGKTDMACVAAAVDQTREHAYAHHIQRLMVTGNFALLAGVDPHALHLWYLSVYADAYEWVEMPNSIGMSQFADGGLLASKPYISSGAYINRMSDYCGQCAYDVKARHGKGACPFNPLYWNFIAHHKPKLANNPRMGMMVRTYEKMDEAEKTAITNSAALILADVDASAASPHWTPEKQDAAGA